MRKKKIVIFRAKGPVNNIYLYQNLINLNYKVITLPILRVKEIYKKKILINSHDLVVTTSFYGIYYFSKLTSERGMYIFTLGKASTYLAKKLGFKNIIECTGDSVSMLDNIKDFEKNFKRTMGDIIYAGAKNISFNLPAKLEELGYSVIRYKIYSSDTLNNFTKGFIQWVKKREVSWVILLSAKGARAFNVNSKKVFSKNDISNLKFACISKNVAKNLETNQSRKFFPDTPNVDYIKDIILKYEREYGT